MFPKVKPCERRYLPKLFLTQEQCPPKQINPEQICIAIELRHYEILKITRVCDFVRGRRGGAWG